MSCACCLKVADLEADPISPRRPSPRRLNIFTPRKRIPDKLFPVMVWYAVISAPKRSPRSDPLFSTCRIHGGGFVSGSSNEEKYDPSDLMSRAISMNQPFVFVSIKYV